jgi:hypothetical protein
MVPGKNARPYLKNNSSKKGLGAWIKWYSICLTNTHKALNLNPSTMKEKKRSGESGCWFEIRCYALGSRGHIILLTPLAYYLSYS